MEKPRKRFEEHNDESGESCGCESLSESYPCEIEQEGYNSGLDAMSTWIDGEIPNEKEIEDTIRKCSEYNHINAKWASREIRALLTQRLGGKP